MHRHRSIRRLLVASVLAACVLGAAFAADARAQTAETQQIQELLDGDHVKDALSRSERLVELEPDNPMGWFLLARARHADGDLVGAIDAGRRATAYPSVRASAFYNLACAYALTGRPEEALAALTDAKRAGYSDRKLMAADPDLDSIRNDPRFTLPVERQFDVLDVGDGRGLPYSVDLPVGFDPEKTYPVLVGPGDAEPGEGGSLYWGEDACQRGWIVVESPSFLGADPVEKTAKLLDKIAATYRVDGGKFHMVGFSVNSAGAFWVVAAVPERFHSVTGVPGHPSWKTDADLLRFKGVIVNFIVGELDEYWLGEARLAHRRLQDLGVESYLEIIPGGGHVLPELFGGEFIERMDALRSRDDRER